MRLVKWASLVIVLVVVVAIGVVMTVLATTDFNAYRDEIAAEIRDRTGRALQIDGDLDVDIISFRPAIIVNDVAFANAEWGTRPNMVQVERVEMRVSLLALLFGGLSISEIVLVGADIYLETGAEGRRNWVIGPAEEDDGGSGVDIPFIENIRIDRSRIVYHDGFTDLDSEFVLQRIRLRTPTVDGEIQIEIEGSYNGTPVSATGTTGSVDSFLSGSAEYPINLAVTYADSDMDVHIVADLSERVPQLAGSITSDRLNLDTLGQVGPDSDSDSAEVFSDEELPIGALRAFDANIDVAAEALIMVGNSVSDARGTIALAGGNFVFTIRQAQAAQGNLEGRLNFDLRRRTPGFELSLEGDGLSLSNVTQGALDEILVDAPLDLSVRLSGAGRSSREVAASLGGYVVIDIGSGVITSAMYDRMSRDLLNAILPWSGGDRSPTLHCLVGRFDFRDGVGSSRVLVADSSRMAAIGGGTVNLRTERIDLLVRPIAQGLSLTQIGALIPVRIAGPLDDPRASAVPGGVVESVGEAITSVPGRARNFVDSLFGDEQSDAGVSGVSCANARAVAAGEATGDAARTGGRDNDEQGESGGGGVLNRLNPFD